MINHDVVKFYMDERLKYIEGKSDKKMFEVLQGIPSTPLQNYFYLNQGACALKMPQTPLVLQAPIFPMALSTPI